MRVHPPTYPFVNQPTVRQSASHSSISQPRINISQEPVCTHLVDQNISAVDLFFSANQIGSKSRLSNLWIKMKPEYSGETDDLDLIILAAGYAHGKMRAGLLSKFLVGVAVPTLDGSPPTKFYAISRVRREGDGKPVPRCGSSRLKRAILVSSDQFLLYMGVFLLPRQGVGTAASAGTL